jgi:hypothetical protein
VCDDSSDDGTVDLVRAIAGKRAKIVVNARRLGLAGNWNQCMAESRTPWVNIFHQDDVMLPGHLDWFLGRIKQLDPTREPVGLVAGPVRVIDEQSREVPEDVVAPGGIVKPSRSMEFHVLGLAPGVDHLDFTPMSQQRLAIWWHNPLRCSAVITNRAAHAEAGGFDPSFRYVVDWEFWYRVSRTRILSWKRFEPTVLVRWHAASETHRFKTGTDDLEETARLLALMFEQENHGNKVAVRGRRRANQSLSRAYLNRSHEALRNDQVDLARSCLARAWGLSPRKVIRTLGTDPRLAVQMAALRLAPQLARRMHGGPQRS